MDTEERTRLLTELKPGESLFIGDTEIRLHSRGRNRLSLLIEAFKSVRITKQKKDREWTESDQARAEDRDAQREEMAQKEARHRHVAAKEGDMDTCGKCGKNLRDEVHFRISENGGQVCDMKEGPCSCGAWH